MVMQHSNPSRLPVLAGSQLPALDSGQDSGIGFGGDNGGPAPLGTDWRRVRSALWRFKWLMVTVPLLAAAGGYGVSRFVKPVYTARSTILINRSGDVAITQAQQQRSQLAPQAWVDFFRSYAVIDRVVSDRHLALYIAPSDSALVASFAGFEDKFTPGHFLLTVDSSGTNYVLTTVPAPTKPGVVVDRGAVGGPIGKNLGYKWTPPAASLRPGSTFSVTVVSPRQASLALLERLKVGIDESGMFLHAELTGTDQVATAATLNSISAQFVQVASNMKNEGLSERTRILGEQVKSAQRDLATAEAALEQFRTQNVMRPSARGAGQGAGPGAAATGNPDANAYFTMQATIDSLNRERATIRRVLAEASDSGLVVSKLEDLPSVRANTDLSTALRDLTAKRAALPALRAKYTDLHPQVVKARADIAQLERVDIPAMANRVASSLAVRDTILSKAVTSTATDLKESPALASTETRLDRNEKLAEALYSQLQPLYTQAQLAEQSAVADVSVLDPAEVPQVADKILTMRLVLVAFLAGIGLASISALTLDRLDPKFRYPDQVSRDLGLSILGALPHVTAKGKTGKLVQENAAFQEAIRDVRMNVEYSYGSAGPLVFTISSSGPSDGKSFLASNLALSFAESGRRTLLIDADLRRGELHRRCGVSRRPGLTDCLRGDVTADAILQHTKYANFDVAASGTRKHDAPELLGSQATAQLFGEFRARYDVIICDSPPLSAGIDPFVLSALSGNLLLVVRTGVSVREVIESKLEVLGRMPVRVLGAVLNDVPRGSIYGQYGNYIPGYDTSDETGAALERIIV